MHLLIFLQDGIISSLLRVVSSSFLYKENRKSKISYPVVVRLKLIFFLFSFAFFKHFPKVAQCLFLSVLSRWHRDPSQMNLISWLLCKLLDGRPPRANHYWANKNLFTQYIDQIFNFIYKFKRSLTFSASKFYFNGHMVYIKHSININEDIFTFIL